jgi:hypothetical protein
VDLDIRPGLLVAGQAATDVVHLLAELFENATKFSPRDTRVQVLGYELTSGGVLLEVHDSGVGMSDARLAEMNQRLDDPPPADVSVSRHMGLFAVSHLAARHGVRVRLRAMAPGGLNALVWLPDSITGREEVVPRSRDADVHAAQTDHSLRVGGYLPISGLHRPAHARPASHSTAVAHQPAAVATSVQSSASGLPTRIPQANRISGSAGIRQSEAPQRSAEAARARLSGLQRGTRRADQQITRAAKPADQERTDH